MSADLFENFDQTESVDPFSEKKKNADGIYRVNPEMAKDASKGYVAKIRFLPNFTQDEEVGPSAMEKATHYVKLPNHPQLNGYYDSLNNFDQDCPLTNTFWELRNSNNDLEKERSKMINRSVRYYSYILIVEDKQQPELEGKIMVLQYGIKIANKIKEERMGMYGEKCNVFDLADGKDFMFIVKKIGGYNNYDSSKFLDKSPLTMKGSDGKMKTMPTEETEDGKKVIHTKARGKIKKFLLNREVNLEDFEANEWDDDTSEKVKKIVGIVTGKTSESSTEEMNFSGKSSKSEINGKVEDVDDFEPAMAETDDDEDDIDKFFEDDL